MDEQETVMKRGITSNIVNCKNPDTNRGERKRTKNNQFYQKTTNKNAQFQYTYLNYNMKCKWPQLISKKTQVG